MDSEEIVILGAGLAGLTAAFELEKAGIPYLILEARDRIGGRVLTITTDTGAIIEMGATWFADKHTHLMELIMDLEVPYQKQYTGSRVLYDYANPDRTIQLFELPLSNESQYLFTNGTQSLLDALYQRIYSKQIRLGQQVQKLVFEENGVRITANGQEILSERVISTLPPHLFLNTIRVSPDLPSGVAEVLGQTHTWMGESIKAGLEYAEGFWRKREIGTLLSQFGPVQELHDHQHDGKEGYVLKGFVSPDLHLQGKEVREEKVLEQMKLYFGEELPEATYYEKDWQRDPLTFFPYSSTPVPHQNNGHPLLRESFFDGRLYFAGSETAQAFPGYLDGAIERGQSVVHSLLQEFSGKAQKFS